jgi:hypothetical protein
MKNLRIVLFLSIVFFGFLSSCYLPLPEGAVEVPAVQHVPYSGSFSYTVNVEAGPKDVYFVFTNPSTTADSAGGLAVSPERITVDGKALPAPSPQPLFAGNTAPRTAMERIQEFNRNPFSGRGNLSRTSSFIVAPLLDTAGVTSGPMFDLGAGNSTISVGSTCQYVSTPAVAVAGPSTRILNVWVANNCWEATGNVGTGLGEKRHLVTLPMVEALADKFLTPGLNNDIYDWVTAILGPEWGSHSFGGVCIPPNAEITILLSDIEEDNSDDGGIVGYFYAGNNFEYPGQSDSNERIMFVIDAVMYANPNNDGSSSVGGTGWAATDYWSEECFSTLAHEFQHMIEFYQKQILRVLDYNVGTDAWVNEMCSMIVEDLVADKLGVDGPRGVAASDPTAGAVGNRNGRIPLFNYYTYAPLAIASGYSSVVYYSVTYSFGSWLARNYGGAELIRSIVQSAGTDQGAILSAISAVTGGQETFASLMDKWSASVLISDRTTAPAGYRYNSGGWVASSVGGQTYNLGSINLFNYYQGGTADLGPYAVTETGSLPNDVPYFSSNLFYLAGAAQSGSRTWNITLPDGIVMSVVVK